MQFTPRYLVNNLTTIVANDAGFVTEYRPVYQRQLKVYKGIDNVLQFRLLNADQKPVTTSVYTPKFVAYDETNTLVIEHDGSIQQLDDSSATRGMFTVTITENDLLNIPSQYLKYNISVFKKISLKRDWPAGLYFRLNRSNRWKVLCACISNVSILKSYAVNCKLTKTSPNVKERPSLSSTTSLGV